MALFAYEPVGGYRDAVELPWEEWKREASAGGGGVADPSAPGPGGGRDTR